ncbi:MAG: hypothetical protein QOI70_88 [Microbacteriaceae bacterium]|nr:hypothetical protein [Microbacteriaceae bacterium]
MRVRVGWGASGDVHADGNISRPRRETRSRLPAKGLQQHERGIALTDVAVRVLDSVLSDNTLEGPEGSLLASITPR